MILAAVGVALLAAGCAKSADDDSAAPAGAGGQQSVKTVGPGDTCTYEKYNGGVPKIDLKSATVGFAQSEKEANPFRIAETAVHQGRGGQARDQADHHQRAVATSTRRSPTSRPCSTRAPRP